jgi:hypothetical protein
MIAVGRPAPQAERVHVRRDASGAMVHTVKRYRDLTET